MNIKSVLYNIFVVLVITSFSAYLLNNYNIEDNIIIFVGGYIMFYYWQYFISKLRPFQITKDSDEILHPVIETVKILHTVNIQKHYGKNLKLNLIEKCNCGSTLFRIYNEDTPKGTYIQYICVNCNQKVTELKFNLKSEIKQ